MQFKSLTVFALALSAMSLSACNPWFDYAPASLRAEWAAERKAKKLEKSRQTCAARDLQYLVGQPRTVLQTIRFGSVVRIEEPGQAYTEEFNPARTRIIIGTNGRIRRIVCG